MSEVWPSDTLNQSQPPAPTRHEAFMTDFKTASKQGSKDSNQMAYEAVCLGLRIAAAVASQAQGIQPLLQAEKLAAEKVSEARKRKNRRLKPAKDAAQAEIEQYRQQREKEFKVKEAAALGCQGSCSTEVEKETQEKMTILQTYFQQNREEVLANLLAFVCDIRPEIHENYRING
ncbi:V-type proton ATPase subunit G 1-like [Hyaena hyaena]|uniref:V-type proton ATPase subunit G 1-like n=1 Tax=Hyaena hyaena TaxID=95912 RepID=UPI0019245F5E|nr:V-type proton ATPase subunit G 1-like [Hyaena hyaena]